MAWARVTTVTGPLDQFDIGIKVIQETVIPTAKQWQGFKGGWWLGDRQTGKLIGITLWETEQALRASEEAANKLRQEATEQIGGQVQTVESFEVIAQA